MLELEQMDHQVKIPSRDNNILHNLLYRWQKPEAVATSSTIVVTYRQIKNPTNLLVILIPKAFAKSSFFYFCFRQKTDIIL